MAAAKKIVGEINGRIDLNSIVGEGTVFHIRLSIRRDELPGEDDTHGPGGS